MSRPESHYIHAFNLMEQFGPARLGRLKKHFSSFSRAFSAGASELAEAGFGPKTIYNWLGFRDTLNLDAALADLEKSNIKICLLTDGSYPLLLRQIRQPPPLFYYRGRLPELRENCLAVVGTRHQTLYGKAAIQKIVRPLATSGLTIVSGLALGIDASAHQAALDCNGQTIAVLGGGLDDRTISPAENRPLAQNILRSGGALISEYPPGVPSLKQHFIMRNRIISGLSLGTLVIECAAKSGALITANYAKKQERKIYAIPGDISDPYSKGPNNLLKIGATAVTEPKDILADLNFGRKIRQKLTLPPGLTPEETKIWKSLNKKPLSVDDLISKTGLTAAGITASLTMLELRGLICSTGPQHYSRKHD